MTMLDAQWDRALRLAQAIERLAGREETARVRGHVSRVVAVDEAAAQWGISRRQVYVLPRRFGASRVW